MMSSFSRMPLFMLHFNPHLTALYQKKYIYRKMQHKIFSFELHNIGLMEFVTCKIFLAISDASNLL